VEISSISTRQAEGSGECGSGVFITEEVDGVGDKGLGDSTMVDTETLLEVFFWMWDYCPQLLKYLDLEYELRISPYPANVEKMVNS